jgi:hypothetical protein
MSEDRFVNRPPLVLIWLGILGSGVGEGEHFDTLAVGTLHIPFYSMQLFVL